MTTLWVKRKGAFLFAYDEGGMEVFDKLPTDKPLHVEITQPRNYERLKLRWALIHIVAKAFNEDPEETSDKIKIAVGHFTEMRFPDGRVDRRAKSISYANMDEIQFAEHFEREIAAVYSLYGIMPKDAQREIDEMLSPKTERTR